MRLCVSIVLLGLAMAFSAVAGETPYGKGLTEANIERLVLDDMEDVSDWYNGSPDETALSASPAHARQGKSLKFANVVDHAKGEPKYPVGWPRTGKDLARAKMTDWSGYDFFECWIYAQTSRAALPAAPLSVGFYHSGPRRSTSLALNQVRKDAWVRIVVPVAELSDPKDVQRVQFSISESSYRHGDRVDFFIDEMALARYADPAIAELTVERRLLFSGDRTVAAEFKLVGRRGLDEAKVEFEVGSGDAAPAARAGAKAARQGEIEATVERPLPLGTCWGRLSLRDPQGKLIDRKQVEFRVIQGPF